MHKLTSVSEWKSLLESSRETPFIIFKLSMTCSLSGFANRELANLDEKRKELVYKVVVQESRDVSNAIEEDLGVKHETPQVLIVKDGEVVYYVDHEEIEMHAIQEKLEELEI